MSNQLEYLTANFACIRGGFVNVPLNDMLSRDEFRYMLSDSERVRRSSASPSSTLIAELAADLPELEELIGVSETPPEGMTSLEDALEAANSDAPDVSIDPSDLLRLSYTGDDWQTERRQTVARDDRDGYARPRDRSRYSPSRRNTTNDAASAFGWIHPLWAVSSRGTPDGYAGVRSGGVLRLVEEEGITWTFLVPTMIYDILDSDALPDADVSGIDTIVYGAAPITSDRLTEALDVFREGVHPALCTDRDARYRDDSPEEGSRVGRRQDHLVWQISVDGRRPNRTDR